MLSYLVFLPLLFAIFAYFLNDKSVKINAVIFSLIIVILNIYAFTSNDLRFAYTLINTINFGIILDANNIALLLALVANFMLFISMCFFDDYKKDFLICAMILSSCMNGLFFTNDALLFYIFWEVSLLPLLYLMLKHNQAVLAKRFFIFAFLGSILMLLSIIYLALNSFNSSIMNFNMAYFSTSSFTMKEKTLLFLGFFLAFIIKAPIFPMHSWAIKTYDKAPNFVSVMLVAFKMAPFGFLKFLVPLFADVIAQYHNIILSLCLISALYAALLAASAKNYKELCALSSISHIGILSLGVFSLNQIAITGAVFYMIAHAIVSGAMFLFADIIYKNTKTYELDKLKGLAFANPKLSLVFGILLFSSISLPLTINFVGEFMVLYGLFENARIYGIIATFIVVLGAIYMLKMFRECFLGQDNKLILKANLYQKIILGFLCFLCVLLGVVPNLILELI